MRRPADVTTRVRGTARFGFHASLRRVRAALSIAVFSALLPAGPLAAAGPASTALTPARDRITDSSVERDHATLEALGRRLAALDTITVPRRLYARTQAQGWLAVARDQYALNDRSGLAESAYGSALALATMLEAGGSTLEAPAPPIAGSRRLRDDLWQLADSLKKTEALRCVAEKVAKLELTLVRAGHEALLCRKEDPHPHAGAADIQADQVRRMAADCVIPVAVAPAPVEAPAPEPAPEPVPSAVETALQQLGALNNVHFDINADTLSATSAQVLDSVAAVMKAVLDIKATLIGHTDPRGSVTYNLALGRRRANAVRNYLASAGVDTSRISFASAGASAPVALGTGLREHALNRRVEIQYTGPGNLRLDVRHQERDVQIEKTRPRAAPVRRPATGVRKPTAAAPKPKTGTGTKP